MNRYEPHPGDLIKHTQTGKLALVINIPDHDGATDNYHLPVIMIRWFGIKEFAYIDIKSFELMAIGR